MAFSTHLQDMWIDGASGSVTFLMAVGGITVFSAVYVPDGNGNIRLYNLRRILESHIDGVFADFVFRVVIRKKKTEERSETAIDKGKN